LSASKGALAVVGCTFWGRGIICLLLGFVAGWGADDNDNDNAVAGDDEKNAFFSLLYVLMFVAKDCRVRRCCIVFFGATKASIRTPVDVELEPAIRRIDDVVVARK